MTSKPTPGALFGAYPANPFGAAVGEMFKSMSGVNVPVQQLAQIQAAQDEQSQRQVMDGAHLTDQLELYERFEYKPMPFTQAEVMAAQ